LKTFKEFFEKKMSPDELKAIKKSLHDKEKDPKFKKEKEKIDKLNAKCKKKGLTYSKVAGTCTKVDKSRSKAISKGKNDH
jgi:hypothetical protein